ncbi:MAG: GAF domain-containing protein [Chloroflexi bacterium]|nr:GAF domain-containing protein [Chloroflexota bacterium]
MNTRLPESVIKTWFVEQILEQATDFVALIKPDGQLVYVNENGRMLLSIWDEADLDNLTIADLVAEGQRPLQVNTAIPTALQEGSWQGELTYLSQDGLEIPISQKIINTAVGDEENPLLVIFARDITERKWVETSLQESETRFRSSFENTSLGMALVSTEGRFLQVNDPLCAQMGYDEQEFLSLALFDLLQADGSQEITLALQRLQSGAIHSINQQLQFVHKNGRAMWANLNASTIVDIYGRVTYFLVQMEDIHQRKELENQVQESLQINQRQLEINQALATAQSEQEILDIIVQKAGYFPNVALSFAFIEYDGGERVDVVRALNTFNSGIHLMPLGMRTLWKDSPITRLYAEETIFVSGDVSADGRIDKLTKTMFATSRVKSFAILPLVASGEWLGNMAVMSKDEHLFDETVLPFYRNLAEQAGIALRAARLLANIQASLESRSREVALSVQIAQEIATAHDLSGLYERVVNQVKESYQFYHVQLLRYDPFLDTVALIYGYGEIGAKMLALNHSMPMGVGLIGTAAATGQIVRRDNVASAPDWQPNPLLAETRSEIAVPIKLRDEVLGVLDIQSDKLNAFSDNDQLVLEGLCGQIAIAIESTRLREEMDARMSELTTLQRYMSREGWETYRAHKEKTLSGYQFDHQGVATLSAQPAPNAAQTNGDGRANPNAIAPFASLDIPLTVLGGEIIGQLGVQSDPENPLSDDELEFLRSISTQVAEALEAARLFEQTQESLNEQERLSTQLETVAQVSTAASTMLEADALLQAVVDLTRASFNLYHTHIYLLDEDRNRLVLRAGADQVGRLMTLEGREINLNAESLVARAARTRVGIVENDVRKIVDFLPNPLLPHTRAELAVPMVVGDRLIGVLDLQADRVDYFTEEDVNIHRTLASQVAVAVQNATLFAEQVQASDKLREVDRLKSEFLASMSHELRTPLNSIIGFADVLLEGLDGDLNERMEEDVRLIRDSGNHLRALIGDILDMSKIEAGRMELRYEEIDMRQMANDVIATAAPLAEAKKLALYCNIDDDVDIVEADRTRLRQVMWNIVGNAIKFTEKGHVALNLQMRNNNLLVAIEDTGIGIKEENVSIVFEQFRQIDGNLNRSAGGTGLGMPITKKLIELHGGEIWVESAVGKGSTFWFTIPNVQYIRRRRDTAPLDME